MPPTHLYGLCCVLGLWLVLSQGNAMVSKPKNTLHAMLMQYFRAISLLRCEPYFYLLFNI